MPVKVEAALVTQKRPSATFNNDSVNLNGKVFDREVIRNGYKGSGIINGDSYFVLASSEIDGFADAAVTAFNENAVKFATDDPQNVFEEYYSMCKDALMTTSHKDAVINALCFYASGRRVVVSSNGNSKVYNFTADGVTSFGGDMSATENCCGSCVYPDVSVGDIFVLVGPGVAATLSDKDINDIFKVSESSVKRIVNLISKVALSKIDSNAVSVAAIKILETGVDTDTVVAGFAPDFSDVKNDDKNIAAEADNAQESTPDEAVPAVDEALHEEEKTASEDDAKDAFIAAVSASIEEKYTEILNDSENEAVGEAVNSGEVTEEALSEEAEKEAVSSEAVVAVEGAEDRDDNDDDDDDEAALKTAKSGVRQKLIIGVGAMALLSVILLAVVFAVRFIGGSSDEENSTLPVGGEVVETSSDAAQETTTEDSSDEETTDEETTLEEEEEETTTKAEETTTKAEESTTKAEESTTKAEESTTKAEETTTKAEEITTKAEETTTKAEETTTKVEETTAEAETEESKADNENSDVQEPDTDASTPQVSEPANDTEETPAGDSEEEENVG